MEKYIYHYGRNYKIEVEFDLGRKLIFFFFFFWGVKNVNKILFWIILVCGGAESAKRETERVERNGGEKQ